ncbi:MAG TPA: transglycosylase SLT domain-containing protein [Candidatus Limnocylindrales bacterium]|nr:transglycosylase SLT domain-containing protein [Candidatus Limnocylindrales bacterium]
MNVPVQSKVLQTKGFRVGRYSLFSILLLYLLQTSLTVYLLVDRTREVEKLKEKINNQQLKLQAQDRYIKHLEKVDVIQSMLKSKDSQLSALQQQYSEQRSALMAQAEALKAKEAENRLGSLLAEKDQKLEELQNKYRDQIVETRILSEKFALERELQDMLAEKEQQLNELREKYYLQQVSLLAQETAINNFKEKERVAQILEKFKTGLSKSEEESLRDIILSESKRYGLDPNLILALIQTESTFNNWAKSKQGAMGLMQIHPPTGKSIAEDANVEWKGKDGLYEPDKNIRIGLHYLAQLILHFQDIKLALAAYNMGPTAVKRLLEKGEEVPQEYVDKVIENYKILSQTPASSPEPNGNGKNDRWKIVKEEKEK